MNFFANRSNQTSVEQNAIRNLRRMQGGPFRVHRGDCERKGEGPNKRLLDFQAEGIL